MMLCLCPLTQGYRLPACHWLAEMLMLLRTAQRGVPHCDIRRTVEPVPGLTVVIMYQGWDGGLGQSLNKRVNAFDFPVHT